MGLVLEAPAEASGQSTDALRVRRVAGLLPHLGKAARTLRRERGIKLVRVGAALDKTEAALARFERGEAQPNDLDATIQAYAEELDIDPIEIWQLALEYWDAADDPRAA